MPQTQPSSKLEVRRRLSRSRKEILDGWPDARKEMTPSMEADNRVNHVAAKEIELLGAIANYDSESNLTCMNPEC